MAFRKGTDDPAGAMAKPASLSDALLYTTICIVGLPVEVQVKDGSIYLGVFHTACLEDGYGIILKRARKIGRGKHEKNFATGPLLDTLVLLSDDLVQIVVKDFHLPAEEIFGNIADGVVAVTETIDYSTCDMDSEREPKPSMSTINSPSWILEDKKGNKSLGGPNKEDAKDHEVLDMRQVVFYPENKQEYEDAREDGICLEKLQVEEPSLAPIVSVHERQAGEDMPHGEANSSSHIDEVSAANNMVHEDHHLSPCSAVCLAQVDPVDETHGDITFRKTSNRTPSASAAAFSLSAEAPKSIFDPQTSTPSTSSTSVLDIRISSSPVLSTSLNPPVPKKSFQDMSVKEFKLNPGAKVFSPSFANSRSPSPAVPTIEGTGYMSNIPPIMPIAAPQPGLEISTFASCPSPPTKLVQYNSLVTGHSSITAQYSRPIMGHAGARQQPFRFSGQYHPVQAGAAYVHPTSQAVMVGRMGQLVYVHPISQDAIQGTPVLSQGSSYPLFNPCQANIPKIHGNTAPALHLCMTPPLVTSAPQPFPLPSHIPFAQHSFPAVRPRISVPAGNGFFGS